MSYIQKPNTCPKCGSPQVSTKLDGTTARIWFVCGSYGYADKPDQVFRSSDKCLDREEINTLQRKVKELQVALDFANEAVDQRERSRTEAEAKLDDLQASTIHSCGDSCSRPMCVLRRERDAYKEALEMIAYNCNNPRADYQAVADAALTAIEDMRAKEGEANVPLEENEGLHEDIIFWLTRAANWRCISASLLVYAEYLLKCIPDRSEIDWTVLEQARAMFKEEGK